MKPKPVRFIRKFLVATFVLAGCAALAASLEITRFDLDGVIEWADPGEAGTVVIESLCDLGTGSWSEIARVDAPRGLASAKLDLCQAQGFYRAFFIPGQAQATAAAFPSAPAGEPGESSAAAGPGDTTLQQKAQAGILARKTPGEAGFTVFDPSEISTYTIDRSKLEEADWLEAIRRARHHQGGKNKYSLLRVVVRGADTNEILQAATSKLKELTEEYDGGGGYYFRFRSGDFLFWEHIDSAAEREGQYPILLGNNRTVGARLWVTPPAEGELNIVGDVELVPSPAVETGRLEIEVRAPSGVVAKSFVVDPVVVGGPYGTWYELENNRTPAPIELAAGAYKLLMPDFDLRGSRWMFTIVPGTTTRLEFESGAQTDLSLVGESVQ